MLVPDNEFEPPSKLRPWQIALNRFFNRASFELLIGTLVLFSVVLTLVEFWMESELTPTSPQIATPWVTLTQWHLRVVTLINDYITNLFIAELCLRFAAASSKSAFFAEFWIDILAVIPLFRIFRSARALRLLRIVRLFRLLGVFARLSSHYPRIFRNNVVDFLIVVGMLLIAVVFGTIAITHFEKHAKQNNVPQVKLANANLDPLDPATTRDSNFDMQSSFWFSIYTLLAGEPVPAPPKTVSSRIVTVFLMLSGMAIFAIFAGTVSAFMVDRMRTEGRVVEWLSG